MQGENPENGRLVSRQSGSEQYTGYHTIELEQPAVLHSNSQFSIVIEFDNPEYENPIPVETYGCEDPEEDFVEEMGTGHEATSTIMKARNGKTFTGWPTVLS